MPKITVENIHTYTKLLDGLYYFTLFDTSMSDDDIRALLEILRDRHDIVELGFDNCQLTDTQIEMILNSLPDNKISGFSLLRNPITTHSANAIANALQNKHVLLTDLLFIDNSMSNESATIIAKALKEDIHLTSLRIHINDALTHEVYDVFYEASIMNSRVKILLPQQVDLNERIYSAYGVHEKVIEITNRLYAALLAVETKEARTTLAKIKASVDALTAIKTELDDAKYQNETIIYQRLESAIAFFEALGLFREGKTEDALQKFNVFKSDNPYYLDMSDELIAHTSMDSSYFESCAACIKKLEELKLGTANPKMIQKISSGIILLEAKKCIIAGDADTALIKAVSIQEEDPNFCIAQGFILDLAMKFISIRHVMENETPAQHLERLESCQEILKNIKTDNDILLNTDIPSHTQSVLLIVGQSYSRIKAQLSEQSSSIARYTK